MLEVEVKSMSNGEVLFVFSRCIEMGLLSEVDMSKAIMVGNMSKTWFHLAKCKLEKLDGQSDAVQVLIEEYRKQ